VRYAGVVHVHVHVDVNLTAASPLPVRHHEPTMVLLGVVTVLVGVDDRVLGRV